MRSSNVKTCRRRMVDMVPEWYQIPVFYFSNPAGVIGNKQPSRHRRRRGGDYELELACVMVGGT